MTYADFIQAAIGGLLIGISATLLLAFCGRIAGISGIYLGVLRQKGQERLWRLLFIIGLLIGGSSHFYFQTYRLPDLSLAQLPLIILAGLLVGFGTRLGGGCTSGHGVCGIGRLSVRSILATLIFMFSALATVLLQRYVL